MNENNLELLDLDDGANLDDGLPPAAAFAAPRPKKPWLLMAIGVAIIVLATYIIVRAVGGDSSSAIEVDLDAPVLVTADVGAAPVDVIDVPAPVDVMPMPAPKPQPKPQPMPQPKPQPAVVAQNVGTPVRVVEERKEVKFEPAKATVAKKPVVTKTAPKKSAAPKPAPKPQTTSVSNWYVQFGSYSTRALAESAQRQITSGHSSLFAGKQFVILAAVLPDGKTTYRLRVGFNQADDARGFCQNAKSDGLDCYVAK